MRDTLAGVLRECTESIEVEVLVSSSDDLDGGILPGVDGVGGRRDRIFNAPLTPFTLACRCSLNVTPVVGLANV